MAYNFRAMPTIGQELRRERELRGIALSDIAKITKIKLTSLQYLEEDKLNLLPGEFFIKGMIRAYAKVVGLDEQQLLTLYEHSLQQKALDQAHEARRKETHILKSHKSHLPLILIAALLVVAVTLLLVFGFAQKKGAQTRAERVPAETKAPAPAVEAKAAPPAGVPGASTQASIRTPTQAQTQSPVQSSGAAQAAGPVPAPAQTPAQAAGQPPPAKVEAQPSGLSLVISAQQETWMQVKADGQVVLGRLLQAGERVTLTCRKEFVIDTGNAGGFTYTLNGRPGKPLGGPGAVIKNVRIGVDNLQDFLGAA